jgi:hypothetical protein
MKKTIDITFKNVADFRARIATLWQKQKEDESYNFIFLEEEAEKEFNDLISRFKI